jgi:hypothetical protein
MGALRHVALSRAITPFTRPVKLIVRPLADTSASFS